MTLALDILSGLLLAGGSFFCLVGGVGLNRFPDFYTRSHAVGVTDTMGAGLILAGLMLQTLAPFQLFVLVKLVTVMVFLLVTSPISGHAVTRAAWQSGLMPHLTHDRRPDAETPPTGEEGRA